MLKRILFQWLPQRVQKSLYYRVLSKFRSGLTDWYTRAPLKLEPTVHMNLCWKDSFHGEIAFSGSYENEVSEEIHSIARITGGLLVDVGANYGYYSLLWCPARGENKALAIEASPRNLMALHENIASNHLGDSIKVYEWAASNRNGQVGFDLGSLEETGWGGIAAKDQSGTVTVNCHRLDEMFPDQIITVLKVDCEGADAWVLEGASSLLAAHRITHVFFEENLDRQEQLGIAAGSSVKLLQKFGYQCDEIGPGGNRNYHAYLTS